MLAEYARRIQRRAACPRRILVRSSSKTAMGCGASTAAPERKYEAPPVKTESPRPAARPPPVVHAPPDEIAKAVIRLGKGRTGRRQSIRDSDWFCDLDCCAECMRPDADGFPYPATHEVWECGLCDFAACEACMTSAAGHAACSAVHGVKPPSELYERGCVHVLEKQPVCALLADGGACSSAPARQSDRDSVPATDAHAEAPDRPLAGAYEMYVGAKEAEWVAGGGTREEWTMLQQAPSRKAWARLPKEERREWEGRHAAAAVRWEQHVLSVAAAAIA